MKPLLVCFFVFTFSNVYSQNSDFSNQIALEVASHEEKAKQNLDYKLVKDTTLTDSSKLVFNKVDHKSLNQGFISSFEQLIQGKVSGVQVLSSLGEPGAQSQINIRGYSSIFLDNNPLIILDGFPLSEFNNTPSGSDLSLGALAAKNPLNFIDPRTIEHIEVLKDASAAAIYGARGANGVVIITTKNGENTDRRLEINSSVGFSSPTRQYELLNAEGYLAGLSDYGRNPSNYDNGADTNWQQEIANEKISFKNDIAFLESYKNGNYRISVGHENQDGVIKNSSLSRYQLGLNLNHYLFHDKLRIGIKLTSASIRSESPLITTNDSGLMGSVYSANPTSPADPEFQTAGSSNPLSLLEYYSDESANQRAVGQLSLDYEIKPGLHLVVRNGYDASSADRTQVIMPELLEYQGYGPGRAARQEMNSSSYLLETKLKYNHTFNKHQLSAMGAFSYQSFEVESTELQGAGFSGATDAFSIMKAMYSSAETIRNAITGDYSQWGVDPNSFFINRITPDFNTELSENEFTGLSVNSVAEDKRSQLNELQSFFGTLTYNFSEKYFLNASFRMDGSSRFGPNNKYGFFPGLEAAWLLSNEVFIPDGISHLRLRSGFGVVGNQTLPHNVYTSRQAFSQIQINSDGTIFTPGLITVAFDDPDLKWEQTQELNAGLDFGFWNNRVLGSVNYYSRLTTDVIISQVNSFTNVANISNSDLQIRNSGVELGMNLKLVDGERFNWNAGFNLSYNDNEIKNVSGVLDDGEIYGQGLTGAFVQRMSEGRPVYSYYLSQFGGFDDNGFSEYEQNGMIQLLDKSPVPKYNLGLYSNASYANFDVRVQFSGQYGHYLYNNTANAYFTAGALGNGRNVIVGIPDSEEAPSNSPFPSTRFLEKANFLRLQNLVLGYTLAFENSRFIESIRIYAVGQNLLTFTQYSGLDPEAYNAQHNNQTGYGLEYVSYPQVKMYTAGLQFVF